MIVDDGEAYGIDIANAAQKAFKAAGVTNIDRESVKETDANPGGAAGFAADIQPVALKAVASGVKLVYAPSQDAPDSQTFVERPEDRRLQGRLHGDGRQRQPDAVQVPGRVRVVLRPEHREDQQDVPHALPAHLRQDVGDRSRSGPRASWPPRCSPSQSRSSARRRTARRSARALVAKKLKTVKLPTTILGYSMAFNNPVDAYPRPEVGRNGVPDPGRTARTRRSTRPASPDRRRNRVRPVPSGGPHVQLRSR